MSFELSSAYFKRIASYSSLPESQIAIFLTHLAHEGFYYTGHDLDIECEECKTKAQICHDLSLIKHKTGCSFAAISKSLVNKNVRHNLVDKSGTNDLTSDGLDMETSSITDLSHDDDICPSSATSSFNFAASKSELPKSHVKDLKGSTSLSQYRNDLTAYFKPEFLVQNSTKQLVNLNFSEQYCEKNPGHFGNINLNLLRLDQIPSGIQCKEMFTMLKLLGDLTVKVIVPLNASQNSAYQQNVKVGTGFIINLECEIIERKYKSINIFIQTSRHLVDNNDEALCASVEFFYNDTERNDIVTLTGKGLMISDTISDSHCLLVCESSDADLIQKLSQAQIDIHKAADQLPVKAKKCLGKKVLIMSHPHGGHKVLSFGDYVTVKYSLNSFKGEQGQTTLTRINTLEEAIFDTSDYRKALFYTADTCPGSCGAPVLTFNESSTSSFTLDIWMHNGLEKEHKLGVTSLKVCAKEDFLQPSCNKLSGYDKAVGENNSQPTHSEYMLYQTRLDSFNGWTLSSTLQPQKLASSGFFYTGIDDHVQCFQCGLGLKSWKLDDDPVVEHQKYRPTCPYLKTLDQKVVSSGECAIADSRSLLNTENIPLKLLEAENKTLKNQLICKVCKKSDVKDMFLPCGELYACSECSKSLTVCPSCQKPILATVTVYMT